MTKLIELLRKHSGSLITWFAIASILLWLFSYVTAGIYYSADFDGFIANGPFQLFNPLRRLAAGQTPGVDFQFFHGIGVPLLHYPLFALFGKGLYASEISRYLTSIIAYVGGMFLFGYAATNRTWKSATIFLAIAIYFLEIVGPSQQGPANLLATPGNSLLGLRSTMPLVFFSVLLLPLNPRLKPILAGVCLAVSILCGTEHGLATVASFIGISLVAAVAWYLDKSQDREGVEPKMLAYSLGSFVISLLLVFLIICGPAGMWSALRFNLVSVPADQFWYFGAPPNDFAATPGDLVRLGWRNIFFFLGVACFATGLAGIQLLRLKRAMTMERFVLCLMLVYGLISCASCLGMLEKGYLAPLYRIADLVMIATAWRNNWLARVAEFLRTLPGVLKISVSAALGIMGVGWWLAMAMLMISYLPPQYVSPFNKHAFQLSITWQKHFRDVDRALLSTGISNPTIWSTYSGLLEEQHRLFLPREDYIIHALGPERRAAYIEGFNQAKPDVVQTIRRDYFYSYTRSHDYEQWLRNTSWDFYEELVLNYDLLQTTDKSVFWKRSSATWKSPVENYQDLPVAMEGRIIDLPVGDPSETSVGVVKVKYEISNPLKKLPFIGGVPRFLIKVEGDPYFLPVAFVPYQKEMKFPIVIPAGKKVRLLVETHSLLPGASIKVLAAGFRELRISPDKKQFLVQ